MTPLQLNAPAERLGEHPQIEDSPVAAIDGNAELIPARSLHEEAALIRECLRDACQNFVEIGDSLLRIHASKLWSPDYKSFPRCCRQEFGLGQSHAYRLMEAAVIMAEMSGQFQNAPINEWQLRELARVPAAMRVEVLENAILNARDEEKPFTAEYVRRSALQLCPEIKAKTAQKATKRTPARRDVSDDEFWQIFISLKQESRVRFLHRLKDEVLTWNQIWKGQERKLCLVESTKSGKPRVQTDSRNN